MDIIQIYTNSPLRNFSYIIMDETSKECMVVDPYDSNQILEFLNTWNLKLRAIINTHEHGDHTCGNSGLLEHWKGDVLCHPKSLSKIATATGSLPLDSRLEWGDSWIEILDTPGHTMGHVSLLAGFRDNPEWILTGDTLFNAGVGNCKNGGDPSVMYQTVQEKYLPLPDSVKIYPGHDYWTNNLSFTLSIDPENTRAKELLEAYQEELKKGKFLVSNLGLEKEISLFFQTKRERIRNQLGLSIHASEEDVFLKLRKLRDSW